MKDFRHIPEIEALIKDISMKAMTRTVNLGAQVSNSIIYASAPYSTGRTRNSTKTLVELNSGNVKGKLTIAPKSEGAITSYAQALDKGHKHHPYGNKNITTRVKGKNYLAPTQDVMTNYLLTFFKKIK